LIDGRIIELPVVYWAENFPFKKPRGYWRLFWSERCREM